MNETESPPIPPLSEEIKRIRKRGLDLFYSTNRLEPVANFQEFQKSRVLSKVLAEYPTATISTSTLHNASGSGQYIKTSIPLLQLTNTIDDSSSSFSSSSTSTSVSHINGSLFPITSSNPVQKTLPTPPTPSSSSSSSSSSLSISSSLITASSAAVLAVTSALQSRSHPITSNANLVDTESEAAMRRVEEIAKIAQSQSRHTAEGIGRRSIKPTPKWHAPWKLMRVISGHQGWVRSIAVEPGNDWFASGAADRTIKIWDLASGTLRVTLTGHVNAVRALVVSPRHPYLFSAGEDKTVKCWDLETNKVIREYHGHLSGVYCMEMHPTLDLLITGGRDSVARVWDMRTKAQTHTLGGHEQTVHSVLTNSTEPQVITGSMDSTIRLWDLVKGQPRVVLTHHKKAVRSMVGHSKEFAFISGAADNLKKWALPDGIFVSNYSGHNTIINSLALSQDDVLVSGGDDGSLKFWDYASGYSFQESQTKAQPGSLESEAGIYSMAFDKTGLRLITGEADKTIKIYKEDEQANEETNPIDLKGFEASLRNSRA